MTLRLRNRWRYQDKDWWSWEAFLDDDGSGELANIEYVEYVLHPTFPNPVRKVTDPAAGFVLKTAGWGTFMLKAFVYTKDGRRLRVSRSIELRDDPPEGVTS